METICPQMQNMHRLELHNYAAHQIKYSDYIKDKQKSSFEIIKI